MNSNNQPGYVLIFSFIVISLVVIIATNISYVSIGHMFFSRTMIARERAKTLAWSGLQIAKAQLSFLPKKKEQKGKKPTEDKEEKKDQKKESGPKEVKVWDEGDAKEFLKNVYPLINSWQTFKISKDKFGVDGEIHLFITSDDGKIDLNQTFDFQERKFVNQGKAEGDFKKFYEQLFKEISKHVGGKDLFKTFDQFLTKKEKFEQIYKNRQNKLYDTTEFFKFKEFAVFQDHFVNVLASAKTERGKKKKNIYWTDIFTIWSGKKNISPWFITDSIKRLLGFKFKEGQAVDQKKKSIDGLLKKFKLNLSWPQDWDTIFSSLYGIKYKSLPKWAKELFGTKFGPKTFSVLSYGIVDGIAQKLFVVLERKKMQQNKKEFIKFDVKKLYWI